MVKKVEGYILKQNFKYKTLSTLNTYHNSSKTNYSHITRNSFNIPTEAKKTRQFWNNICGQEVSHNHGAEGIHFVRSKLHQLETACQDNVTKEQKIGLDTYQNFQTGKQ